MKISLLKFTLLLLALSPVSLHATEITGSGSAYISPLFLKWMDAYAMKVNNTTIKYKKANSSEGIRSIENKEVDFGQTDMPLKIEKLKEKGLFQFPVTLVAFTPIINLPGIYPGQLKLDGQVLGDIFLGKIKKWNDPALVALNPMTPLPNANISVAYRKLGASGTFSLTTYLAKNNPEWKSKVGAGLTVTWPVGHAMETIDDTAKFIRDTPYSIGYTEFSHAIKNKQIYTQLKNSNGVFIKPSPETVAAAAQNTSWDVENGFYAELTDVAGAGSWPMSSAAYVLVRKVSDNPAHSREVLKFFNWALRVGGLSAMAGDFIPLPDTVSSVIRASWKQVVDDKGAPVMQ